MRAVPTITYSALSDFIFTDNVAGVTPTAISIYTNGSSYKTASIQGTVSGVTQFRPYYLACNASTAKLTLSAEL
jgi:hypothetical protein